MNQYQKLFNEVVAEHNTHKDLHKDSKVLIVDGTNLFIRTFSAIPTLNPDGMHIGGLSGFLQSLAATIRMISPSRVVVVFDGKGGSARRRQLYSNYKERRAIKSRLNRVAGFEDITDEQRAMKYQLLRIYYYLQSLPVTTISIDHIEADDTIAYLSSYFTENVVILSNDRDFLQLVSDRVNVYVPTKKKLYTPQNLLEDYGVWCENFTIYKALKGDSSDNIKSMAGFGDKTILKEFPQIMDRSKIDLEVFVESCKLYDGKSKAMLNLKENIDQFIMNYKLMQLIDVDIAGSIKSAIRQLVDTDIPALDRPELSVLCTQDKLSSAIQTWNSWLTRSFGNLNIMRDKKKQE